MTALLLVFMPWMAPDPTQAAEAKLNAKPARPAWQWTLDERLAKRFDPAEMGARAAAAAAEKAAHKDASGKIWGEDETHEWVSRWTDIDVIQGGRNPELFLPGELFTHLLIEAFPPGGFDPSESRIIIEERAAALGFGSDLWTRLRKVAAPVLELEKKHEDWVRKNPSAHFAKEGAQMDDDDLVFCRARATALAQAEAEFGKEPFLRLLYEASIPTQTTYPLYEGIAEHERFLEGGCR